MYARAERGSHQPGTTRLRRAAEVTISGTPHSLSLAVSMVTDIVKGTFKGFALLRQIANPSPAPVRPGPLGNAMAQPRPVYAPGYGLIPPSQVRCGTTCL
jgi:hypothetical protein